MGWSFSKRMGLSVSTLWETNWKSGLARQAWVGARLRSVSPGASCVLELGTGSDRPKLKALHCRGGRWAFGMMLGWKIARKQPIEPL